MSKRDALRFKIARRGSLPRWQLVPDLLDPCLWWVLIDGGWISIRAPSFEEAEAFCVGLYGPSSVPS